MKLKTQIHLYQCISFGLEKNKMKNKKNLAAKDLFTKKYKPRIVKPKKGKGSFKRKKKTSNSELIKITT